MSVHKILKEIRSLSVSDLFLLTPEQRNAALDFVATFADEITDRANVTFNVTGSEPRKIQAIKLARDVAALGLKEAKEHVEGIVSVDYSFMPEHEWQGYLHEMGGYGFKPESGRSDPIR